jgi:hypothetical protein
MLSMSDFYDLQPAERVALTDEAMREKRTLLRRWSTLERERTDDWSPRAAAAALMLTDCLAVVDFGCGTMNLERHLSPSVRYLPVDVVKRDERTVIVDFNVDPLPVLESDAAACLGLIEYLYDVPGFLRSLALGYKIAVLSYNPDSGPDSWFQRRSDAWVNDYSQADMEAMILESGWRIASHAQIERQLLWRIERQSHP